MPLELNEINIANEHNGFKNSYSWEPDQLAIYKRDRGVELGSTRNLSSLVVRARLETATSGLQVRRPNRHSVMLSPQIDNMCRF